MNLQSEIVKNGFLWLKWANIFGNSHKHVNVAILGYCKAQIYTFVRQFLAVKFTNSVN
jgi:hypothetical protein